MIYLKYYVNKFYNFNIKLNYDFKTWKNQASVTLAMVCVIVIAPNNNQSLAINRHTIGKTNTWRVQGYESTKTPTVLIT
jgi:hypothetical protein